MAGSLNFADPEWSRDRKIQRSRCKKLKLKTLLFAPSYKTSTTSKVCHGITNEAEFAGYGLLPSAQDGHTPKLGSPLAYQLATNAIYSTQTDAYTNNPTVPNIDPANFNCSSSIDSWIGIPSFSGDWYDSWSDTAVPGRITGQKSAFGPYFCPRPLPNYYSLGFADASCTMTTFVMKLAIYTTLVSTVSGVIDRGPERARVLSEALARTWNWSQGIFTMTYNETNYTGAMQSLAGFDPSGYDGSQIVNVQDPATTNNLGNPPCLNGWLGGFGHSVIQVYRALAKNTTGSAQEYFIARRKDGISNFDPNEVVSGVAYTAEAYQVLSQGSIPNGAVIGDGGLIALPFPGASAPLDEMPNLGKNGLAADFIFAVIGQSPAQYFGTTDMLPNGGVLYYDAVTP